MLVGAGERRNLEVRVDLEQLAGGQRDVGEMESAGRVGVGVVHGDCPRLYRGANRPRNGGRRVGAEAEAAPDVGVTHMVTLNARRRLSPGWGEVDLQCNSDTKPESQE